MVIDRPKGAMHPQYGNAIYPLDYGYLKDSVSGDGAGMDVWIGSNPQKGIKGVICTIDLQKNDLEVKVLVGCSETEVQMIVDFQNTGSMRAMLIRR